MSGSSDTHLCSVYTEQLRSLNPSLPLVMEHLVKENILTKNEAGTIQSTNYQFKRLCQLLASKGAGEEGERVRAAIKSFPSTLGRAPKNLDNQAVHSSEVGAVMNGRDDNEVGRGRGVGGGQRGQGGEVRGGGSYEDRKRLKIKPDVVERRVGSKGEEGSLKLHSAGLISSGRKGTVRCREMERFVRLFFTLVTQLLEEKTSTKLLGASSSSSSPSSPPLPLWLHVDLTGDQAVAYFPHRLQRSKHSSTQDSAVVLSLSALLSAFKSFAQKYDALLHENKLLTSKADLVKTLTERNAHLEEEIWSVRKQSPRAATTVGQFHSDKQKQLETQLHHMHKQLVHLEKRIEELMSLNEQWTLECREKESQNVLLDEELKSAQLKNKKNEVKVEALQQQIRQLQKLEEQKQKLQCAGCVDTGDRDMMQELEQERDYAVEENIHLKSELEEMQRQSEKYKDTIEELSDRVGNLKVQAQSKVPSLQEFAQLSSENRQLRDTRDQMKADVFIMGQKIKELEKELLFYKSKGLNTELKVTRPNSAGITGSGGDSMEALLVHVQPLQNGPTPQHNGPSNGCILPPPPFHPLPPETNAQPPSRTTESKFVSKFASKSAEILKREAPNGMISSLGPHLPSLTPCLPHSPPSSPSQPVAEVIGGFRFPSEERQCPSCLTVFVTLGEREFQSHVAGCLRNI